jgi:hypothetical protein
MSIYPGRVYASLLVEWYKVVLVPAGSLVRVGKQPFRYACFVFNPDIYS